MLVKVVIFTIDDNNFIYSLKKYKKNEKTYNRNKKQF